MENTTLTIIWIITTILTGFGGVILGHFLTKKQIKEELHAINENNIQTEKRHKEEKFENAIQDLALDGLFKDYKTKYEGFSYQFNSWKSNKHNEHSIWLRKHNITEINDFYNWMIEKCKETGMETCWIDFWKEQIK